MAAPASSPKLRPKKAKAAADATAYEQVATVVMILCAGIKAVEMKGSPTRRKATPKKNHGNERTQTEDLKRKSRYQIIEAAKKTPPVMYRSIFVCPLEPESKTIW